jgi:hypothetical protein
MRERERETCIDRILFLLVVVVLLLLHPFPSHSRTHCDEEEPCVPGLGGATHTGRDAASTRLLEAAIGSSSSMGGGGIGGAGDTGGGLAGLSASLPPAWWGCTS